MISPWRWVLAIAAVVVLVIAYYGLRDRYTPFTSEAYVQAYVTRIAPQVAGTVLSVHVADNQTVSAGQLLFELDPRPYRFAVESAKAAYALAEESVAQLHNELDAANQTIEQATTALDALPQTNDQQPKPKTGRGDGRAGSGTCQGQAGGDAAPDHGRTHQGRAESRGEGRR